MCLIKRGFSVTLIGLVKMLIVESGARCFINYIHVFTEKLIVTHLFKKFSTFHGIQMLISLFKYGLF
jgi:hypothetical protein